jgi:hypothetical protein
LNPAWYAGWAMHVARHQPPRSNKKAMKKCMDGVLYIRSGRPRFHGFRLYLIQLWYLEVQWRWLYNVIHVHTPHISRYSYLAILLWMTSVPMPICTPDSHRGLRTTHFCWIHCHFAWFHPQFCTTIPGIFLENSWYILVNSW